MSRACFAVSALCLSLLACASDEIPVATNYDPLFRFPAQATYVWDDAANSLPDNPSVDKKSTDALLRQVVDEAFAAKGYRVTTGASDFKLSYQYTLHTFKGVESSHATGSVSLLLVERKTGRRVWTGFGEAEAYVGLTPEERRVRLREAFDRMLANFPPTQRPIE